jgi:nucleotide-binding universal stress UspA family protein
MVVLLDDSVHCRHRVDLAVSLALEHGSELVGVYLVPTAEVTPTIAALLPPDVVARRLADSGDAQHRAETAFREAASKAGLTAIEWRAPAGNPIDAALVHTRCTDLAIVGQSDVAGPHRAFARELAENVVLSCGRPALVVPYLLASAETGRNVLVAWNGGREAARAVADAMPLLTSARQVVVASLGRGASNSDTIAHAQAHLASYLRAHKVDARFKHHDAERGAVGERLLSLAADLGSDLIVMGGYGHARSRELILGGVTRTMFEAMTVPVLMSH